MPTKQPSYFHPGRFVRGDADLTRPGPASISREQEEILTLPENRRVPLVAQLRRLYKYFSSPFLLSERVPAGPEVTSGKSAGLQQRGSPGRRRGQGKRTLPPQNPESQLGKK